MNKKNNTLLLCSPQCEKKNRQNLAKCTRLKISSVTQCLQITKNVSLKMFEISRIGKFFCRKIQKCFENETILGFANTVFFLVN